MRKLLTLVLCLIVGIGSISADSYYVTSSGTLKNGGTWRIEGTKLIIDAEEIPNYQPNNIGCGPWCRHTYVTTVELSSRVKKIGKYAFWHAENVHTVYFQNKATADVVVEDHAFDGCYSLQQFDGRYVKTIGERAFYRCINLEKLVLPSIEIIRQNAFEECVSLMKAPRGDSPSIWLTGNTLPTTIANQDFSWCGSSNRAFTYTSVWHDNQGNYKTYTATTYATHHLIIAVTSSSLLSSLNTKVQSYDRILSVIGGPVTAGDETVTFYWCLMQNLLVNGTTDMSRLVIHDSYMNDYASASATPWYNYRSQIKSIDISGSKTTYIGKNAFNGLSNVKNLYLDGTTLQYSTTKITKIGESAFANCTNLENIDFLKNAEEIGKNAFSGCSKVYSKLSIPAATTIGDAAFDGCPFKEIAFGDKLQSIGQNVFRGSFANGGHIYVFSSVPATNSTAFSGASSITKLHVDVSLRNGYSMTAPWNTFQIDVQATFPVSGTWGIGYGTWLIDKEGTLIVKGGGSSGFDNKLPDYANESDQPWYLYRDFIKKIDIAEGLTGIGKNAFAYANEDESQITEVVVPTTVTSIGENAFKNNDQIETVEAEGVKTVGNQAFENCSSLETVKFGKDVTSLGTKVFNQCGLVDVMAVKAATPPAVTSTTFQGLGVTSANAPVKVKAKAAARKAKVATGQKAVTLEVPDAHIAKYLAAQYWNLFTFEYIGEHGGIVESGQAYDGLYVLYTDGTMIVSASAPTDPNNINIGFSISSSAKSQVKRVEIQGTLEKLGYQFEQCPNLEEVVLGPTFTTLYGSFYQCPKLKSINLDNVLYIRANGVRKAFSGCTSLTEVNLPNAQEIADESFKGCTALTKVTLGGSPEIGMYTFQNCSALTSIDLGAANINGAEGCFSGCTNLAGVTFSGTKIPDEFFKNCSALTTIDLGSQVEEIGVSAFESTELNKIYVQRPTAPEAATDAFKNLTLGDIKLYRPYAFRYGYRSGVWYDMDWMDDEDYDELDFPMYFAVGDNAVGMVDESENLYIDAVTGGRIVKNARDLIAPYVPYIKNEIHIGNDVTSLPKGTYYTGMFTCFTDASNAPTSLVIGSGMDTLGDYSLYNNVWDCDLVIDCYALTPPVMDGDHVFNWNMVKNGSQCVATVNVVNDPAVVAAYRADTYWKRFNIGGTLAPADAPTECTVTFVDWDGTVLQQTTTRPGTAVTPPAEPTRDGYIFRGWDSDEYNWVLTDLTITATYYDDTFTVRFYDWDGTRLSEQQVRYSQAAVAPADPGEREGYTYNGWDTDFSNVTMDLNVCASYSPIMFTVTFQDKDGNPLSTQQVQYGTAAVAPEAPEVEGYEFTGWDTDFSNVKSDLLIHPIYQEKVSDVVSYTCDFTTAASKHQNYNDKWTYDTDRDVYGGANNNGGWVYAKMGGKSATLASANPVYVVNNKAFGREIKQIRVTYPSGSFSKTGMSANDWGAKVYSDLACTQLLYTVTGEAIDANGCVLTLKPEEGKPWEAGSVIMVYWNLANTSSTNGIVLVDKIEYLTASDDDRALWVSIGTGIEDVQSDDVRSTKVLHDGQIYIVRPNGAIFNAQGMRVK